MFKKSRVSGMRARLSWKLFGSGVGDDSAVMLFLIGKVVFWFAVSVVSEKDTSQRYLCSCSALC